MFSWNIAKSAEAMVSRWAIKRVCKFLLKKKLGKFILGDIDLNQLDVQLSAGTIQLYDLALNVDYVNQKFGTSAVLVKEGSIGSLMVTMPWKDGGCRIEVDELEIVIAPRREKVSQDEFEIPSQSNNDDNSSSHGLRKPNNETMNSGVANASVDVHEGVKTIAKMVKWLLTSFHVKIRKLIVAFDPLLEEETKKGLDMILVLRISEAECGTHISEDASPGSFTTAHNLLGLSRLTNFVKFQGAELELLHVDGIDPQSPPEHSTETILGNRFSGCFSSGNRTPIISGEKGGFSGNLKLSIPWKNGSLEICKVDADLHIEPLELRFQPSTIRCFILMWDLFKTVSEEIEVKGHDGPLNCSSAPNCCILPPKENEDSFTNFRLMEKEPVNVLLSESHLISDWVSRSQNDINEEEPDFGASVDQFFECFDGLRNSQSALGNSGMWNWTCSVFTAITAASNLASGSLHVPSEQQHVETKFNATIAKLSLLLSFIDEDEKESLKMENDRANTDIYIHCVCAQFVDLFLEFQVRPQEMNIEVIVQHVQVVDHLGSKNDSVDTREHGFSVNPECDIAMIRQMQDGVQGALRTFQETRKDSGLGHQVDYSLDISLSTHDIDRCCHMTNGKDLCRKDITVALLKTSGVSQCHVMVKLGSSGGSLMGPISFSLKLPPLVCWVPLDLITMVLEVVNAMENGIESTRMGSSFASESKTKKCELSPLDGQGKKSDSGHTVLPAKTTQESSIFLPNAKIILCFPVKECKDFSSYASCNQFIAFDFVSPTIGGKSVRSANPASVASSNKRQTLAISSSLHFNLGDFNLFSITPASAEKIAGSGRYRGEETGFSVEKIISVVNGTGYLSLVSLFWQEDSVTGPWIAKKAKILASSEKRSEDKVVRQGSEFVSATTIKETADFDDQTQQEILSSSVVLLHAQLPPVKISLDKYLFENLCGLLNQMIDHFSCVSNSVRTREDHPAKQTSIIVKCDSVTIFVAIEPVGDVKFSMLKELPGSWRRITLQVDKFELLSVSNIGGIRSASFFSMAHGQGSLWGSITKGLHRECLLVSCSDSSVGRGDGGGSNILSSRFSGSSVINLWDPESNHSFTSITVKCATIVAIGGRLDWFDTILSFFSPPSSEIEPSDNISPEKTRGSSFILNLVDVGLSYEPYFKKSVANEGSDLKLPDLKANNTRDELHVACLLAASSLKLSNATLVDCTVGEYKIKLQDLGLLLATVSESKSVGTNYSVEHLSKCGYVKVAQETHVEAVLKTNLENGHVWELECAESHIMLSTCHDTTFGLIRLAAQLQKLFAPDMQNYVVHLENRWNNFQDVHCNSEEWILDGELSPSVSQTETPSLDKRFKGGSLMDEVCEDVFQLDGNSDGQAKILESRVHALVNDISFGAVAEPEEKIPEFIEEYFLSDLRPLSELTLRSQSSDIPKTGAVGDARIGSDGWYGSNSLKILENHALEMDEQNNVRKLAVSEASTTDSINIDVGKAMGRVRLKNMNVTWAMYGGSDWSNFPNASQASSTTCGRDTTACLELAFSGIEVHYDVYPDGDIVASRLALTIQDFFLNDKSDHAPWKLVLGYYQSKKHPRKASSKAVKLNLEVVKPEPSVPLEENRLRIALLPMRLHLHQSQLDFLISFFGGKGSSADPSSSTPPGLGNAVEPSESSNLQGPAISEEAYLTYFQKFDICPMLIRVDYSPCRVDLTALRGGKYVELVNLVPWKGVELQLKHVQAAGLYGWNNVGEAILGEWLEDISRNQIHKLLKGLPPIKSLVAVGSGAAKLVSLPVKSYKKDQRLLKGMQRGTIAFLRSISLEAIGLGVHLAAGAHNILLQAEYILTTIPPSVPWPVESRVATNVRSNQPKDAQHGIQQACQSISDGLGKSASALVQTPLKRYQRGAGMGSALATAMQAAPAAAMAPASAAARAVHCALLGFRNSLDPERKRESLEKYLGRTPPRESMQ